VHLGMIVESIGLLIIGVVLLVCLTIFAVMHLREGEEKTAIRKLSVKGVTFSI